MLSVIKDDEILECPSTLEEFDKYVDKIVIKSKNQKDDPEFLSLYVKSQFMVSKGLFKESLPDLEKAWEIIQSYENDFVYGHYYGKIGNFFASVLDYTGDVIKTEQIFTKLIENNSNGIFLGDYAVFLHRRKRDFTRAQSIYLKALELFPKHSSIHLKYAGFLRHARKDIKCAETHYIESINSNPTNADALGSFASFLHGVSCDIKEAEKFYEQAVQIDNSHANNLCNYGLFLSEEKKQFKKAEELYIRALDVSPTHANTLYNYAVMLDTHCKRKSEAEVLYRKCVTKESKHSFALYNLAVLLEEKNSEIIENSNKSVEEQKQLEEISSFYKRAMNADPLDSITAADCGRFYSIKLDDPDSAEPILRKSLDLDPNNDVALYNLGLLIHKQKNDLQEAVQMFRKLIKCHPKHSAGLHQLGRISVEIFGATHSQNEIGSTNPDSSIRVFDEAMEYFEKAFSIQKDSSFTVLEYLSSVITYGEKKHKARCIKVCESYLSTHSSTTHDQKIRNALASLKSKS
jgi:tetratricopeptide (TPR) repeat protein